MNKTGTPQDPNTPTDLEIIQLNDFPSLEDMAYDYGLVIANLQAGEEFITFGDYVDGVIYDYREAIQRGEPVK